MCMIHKISSKGLNVATVSSAVWLFGVLSAFLFLAQGCVVPQASSELASSSQANTSLAPFTLDAAVHDASALSLEDASGADYIAMNIPFAPVDRLKDEVVSRTGTALRGRGEAHITIITPPEFAVLRGKVSRAEMLALGREMNIQSSEFNAICLGKGEKRDGRRSLVAYFIVVHDQTLLEFRQRVAERFVANGGRANAFQAENIYSHITVGFSQRDLHEADGVLKDRTSCVADLQ